MKHFNSKAEIGRRKAEGRPGAATFRCLRVFYLPPSPFRLPPSGYTLIEMVVAMGLILVLMTVSGTLFVALSRSERNAQRSAAAQQIISQVDNLFRRDVHQARSATIAQDERRQPVLTLSLPGNATIRYAADDAKLVRIAVTDGRTHRDDFRIAAGQWQFAVADRRVELRLTRPADTVTQNSPEQLPLRDCRLMAVLSLTPSEFPQTGAAL